MTRIFASILLAGFALAQPASVQLFDGKSLRGWRWSTEAKPPAPAWAASDGILRTAPGTGQPTYLLTTESFTDFDLTFEWKAEKAANSGIKYRFQGYWVNEGLRSEPEGPGRIEPVALEYQISDDLANRDAVGDAKHSAAALYEYHAPLKREPAAPDRWHTGRIVAKGLHIEHWLDGAKVVDVDLSSPEMQAEFSASRRKSSSPILARQARRTSPIALQFHDGIVEFRNLRIVRL